MFFHLKNREEEGYLQGLLDKGLTGLYHLVSRGKASRYEWAKLTLKLFRMKKALIPVKKEIFNLPAKRPDFSAMSCEKIEKTRNI